MVHATVLSINLVRGAGTEIFGGTFLLLHRFESDEASLRGVAPAIPKIMDRMMNRLQGRFFAQNRIYRELKQLAAICF